MNNIIKSIVASVVSAIIVVGGAFAVYHPKATTIVQQVPQQVNNLRGTTPEISSPYLIVNGLQEWYYSKSNSTTDTSTTSCAFNTPSATTTLEYASLQVTLGTSTATVWSIATSTTQFSTTTNLTSLTLAAGAPGVVNYIGTAGSIFASSTYLNMIPAGGDNRQSESYGTFKCQAVFLQN